MIDEIDKAVEILNRGGIIIFPTDTAFGIGCRIDREDSIKKLFEIRKRPQNKAVPVLVSNIDMAKNYCLDIPKDVIELMDRYWPGALTIVLRAKVNKVPSLVRGGGENIGLRMPNNEIILEIIKRVGVPILGPSANFDGEKTPYLFEDLDENLINLVDFVVGGECKVKMVSTVIDCSVKPWSILRQGGISIQ